MLLCDEAWSQAVPASFTSQVCPAHVKIFSLAHANCSPTIMYITTTDFIAIITFVIVTTIVDILTSVSSLHKMQVRLQTWHENLQAECTIPRWMA